MKFKSVKNIIINVMVLAIMFLNLNKLNKMGSCFE